MAAGLTAFAGVDVAAAGKTVVPDGNDRPGRLDIRSASQAHGRDRVKHRIMTFANWPTSLLGPSTSNFFLLEISTDSDPAAERVVIVFSRPSGMVALVFRGGGSFLGRTDASRPNRHTVTIVMREALLGNPAGYRWQAAAFFRGPGGCRGGCTDRAPDGSGRVLHDLRAPSVSFPQPPSPAATNPYNLEFTVGDAGGSGLAFWRLEQRDDGAVAWTLVDDDSTVGPQSVSFLAAAPGDIDEFRVVAVDEHGNRTFSPIREVMAPP